MSKLEDIAEQIAGESTPPVHLWQPEHVGEIDIVIDETGTWFHEGGQIRRPELVRLFASILWFEQGAYFLVTPVEKLKITVEDVPFIIQTAEYVEQSWVVTTNTLQRLIVSEQHPVELRPFQGQPIPYVNVRYDLWARISRGVYYQWVEQALEQGDSDAPALSSGDYVFSLSS